MYEVAIKNLNWDDAEFYTTFLKEEFEDDIDLEVRQIQTAENFLNEVDEVNALCGSEDVVESYKKFKEGFDETACKERCKDCPDYGECFSGIVLPKREGIKIEEKQDKQDKHYMSADDFKVLLGLLESFVH